MGYPSVLAERQRTLSQNDYAVLLERFDKGSRRGVDPELAGGCCDWSGCDDGNVEADGAEAIGIGVLGSPNDVSVS